MPQLMDKRLILQAIIMWRYKMMNETKLIGMFFKSRQKAIAKYAMEAEAIQNKVLCDLVSKAGNTEWGLKHDYRPCSMLPRP